MAGKRDEVRNASTIRSSPAYELTRGDGPSGLDRFPCFHPALDQKGSSASGSSSLVWKCGATIAVAADTPASTAASTPVSKYVSASRLLPWMTMRPRVTPACPSESRWVL